MNKYSAFILCSLFLSSAFAQSWCPPGATWHHDYFDGIGGVGYVRTEYTGDTLLNGFVCQRLEPIITGYDQQFQIPFTQPLTPRFTRGQAELVELWNGLSFDTLYWFGAAPGDHWDLNDGGLAVVDTGSMLIDGQLLKYLVVQWDEFATGPPQDTIVERLGFLNYYWDAQGAYLFDTGLRWLRCYSDIEIDQEINMGTCDIILGVSNTSPGDRFLDLHPNPGSDHFTLQLPPGDHDLQIFDQLGRSVIEIDRISDQAVIGTASLAPGNYTLLIADRIGRVVHQRWIKE